MPDGEHADQPTAPILGITWQPHEIEKKALSRLPGHRYISPVVEGSHESHEDIDVLVALGRHVSGSLLQQLPNLRLIHLPNHGVDGLERPEVMDEIDRRSIRVAAAAQAGGPIAEFVIMGLIALNRRLVVTHSAMVRKGGDRSTALRRSRLDGAMGGELFGSNLLVIGYGALGAAVAQKASALGMRVTAVKRRPLPSLEGHPLVACVGLDRLDDSLSQADHVVVCVPLTRETMSLITDARLRSMPQGSHVVNVARGLVVDEHAVVRLVREGHLGGALLDVWTVDEGNSDGLVPDASWEGLNIIATPHYSAATVEARLRSLEFIVENVSGVRAGKRLLNGVRLGS